MAPFHFGPAAVLATAVISCGLLQSNPDANEMVLSEKMKISALTPLGRITIEAGKGFARQYSGVDWSKSSRLIPRTTRWYGSFGAYDPAGSSTRGDRLLVDEGRQFFSSESEALRYMNTLGGYYGSLTYNNSGLVIAYHVVEIPNEKPTRTIQVWQFYINGKRPSTLRGAVDENIEISGGTIPDKVTPMQAPIGYERALSDREYTPRK
jgi:hypothetical protein